MKLVHDDENKLMWCISCGDDFHYGMEIRDIDGFGYYHICPKCVNKAAALIQEDKQKASAPDHAPEREDREVKG